MDELLGCVEIMHAKNGATIGRPKRAMIQTAQSPAKKTKKRYGWIQIAARDMANSKSHREHC